MDKALQNTVTTFDTEWDITPYFSRLLAFLLYFVDKSRHTHTVCVLLYSMFCVFLSL